VESELLCYPAIAQAFVFGDARPYCTALIAARRDDVPDALIQRWIDQANSHLPDYARVNNWHRLEKNLTVREGLITPNGRPKRDAIFTRYSRVINALYATPPLTNQTVKRGHPQ
jgi:long-subunit acyl-CoA synthetase (AMP-forming)